MTPDATLTDEPLYPEEIIRRYIRNARNNAALDPDSVAKDIVMYLTQQGWKLTRG